MMASKAFFASSKCDSRRSANADASEACAFGGAVSDMGAPQVEQRKLPSALSMGEPQLLHILEFMIVSFRNVVQYVNHSTAKGKSQGILPKARAAFAFQR
jgi:hypothetical protein